MPRSVESVFPPDRFHLFERVCIFCTHRAWKNGQEIQVTARDLSEIRDTHNAMWANSAKCSPFSFGHTLNKNRASGEALPEVSQPDLMGYAVNLFVDREQYDKENYYLYCKWACPLSKLDMLEQFASISPEYLPKRRLLWPIALLKSTCPELNLPPPPRPYLSAAEKYCYSIEGEQRTQLVMPFGLQDPHKVSRDLISKINAVFKSTKP